MATFSYSYTLTPGTPEDVTQVNQNFTDVKTFVTGALLDGDNLTSTVAAHLGLNTTGNVRHGKSIIATEESRTNTAYGLLTTPDQVTGIVVPTGGRLIISYQALVKNSSANTGLAAIFVGANQVKQLVGTGAPAVAEVAVGASETDYNWISTRPDGVGLVGTAGAGDATIVTTGLVAAQEIAIDVAAGTYTVSVQFKSSTGSVTAKERKLFVEARGY